MKLLELFESDEEPVLTDFSADLDYTTYHVHVYYKGSYIGSSDMHNERFLSSDVRRMFVQNNRDTIDDFLNNIFVQIILNRPIHGEKGITYKSISQADIDRALLSNIKNKNVDVESMINKIEMRGYKPSEELRSALSKSLGIKL